MDKLKGYVWIALGIAMLVYLASTVFDLSFGLESLRSGSRSRSGYAALVALGGGGIAAILYGYFQLDALKPKKVDPEIQAIIDSLDD